MSARVSASVRTPARAWSCMCSTARTRWYCCCCCEPLRDPQTATNTMVGIFRAINHGSSPSMTLSVDGVREVFKISRVGSDRVGSGRVRRFLQISRVEPGHLDPTRPDPIRQV